MPDIPSDDGLQALIEQLGAIREQMWRNLYRCEYTPWDVAAMDKAIAALRVSPPSSPRLEQEGDQATRVDAKADSHDSPTAGNGGFASWTFHGEPDGRRFAEAHVVCYGVDDTDAMAQCVKHLLIDALAAGSPVAGRSSWSDEQATSPAPESQAPPADPQGWQPIETAPKDGTDVLLTDGHYRRVGYWTREIEAWSIDVTGRVEMPTHWMVVPSLPAMRNP